jgi:ribonuclease P protein component
MPGFVLQARHRPGDDRAVGVGFTATRKLGNAVVRNRARRRLREAVRLVLPGPARAGTDYVLVARPGALTCALTQLTADLATALAALGRRLERGRGASAPSAPSPPAAAAPSPSP